MIVISIFFIFKMIESIDFTFFPLIFWFFFSGNRVMDNLAQLEALCDMLYNSQDSAERAHAENTLKCFSVNTDYISQCQYILENALTPYALMLASSSLLKQVTDHSLALNLRLDICMLSVSFTFLIIIIYILLFLSFTRFNLFLLVLIL